MLPISAATREDQSSLKHKCARAVSRACSEPSFDPARPSRRSTRPDPSRRSVWAQRPEGPRAHCAHRPLRTARPHEFTLGCPGGRPAHYLALRSCRSRALTAQDDPEPKRPWSTVWLVKPVTSNSGQDFGLVVVVFLSWSTQPILAMAASITARPSVACWRKLSSSTQMAERIPPVGSVVLVVVVSLSGSMHPILAMAASITARPSVAAGAGPPARRR